METTLKKMRFKWNKDGKYYYLLGKGADDRAYFLEEATFDCEWYWGIGYVESFTNQRAPQLSADIRSHQHFDTLFFNNGKPMYEAFTEFFVETPLNKQEVMELLELMRCLYTARKYSDMLHLHGVNYVRNTKRIREVLTSDKEYTRINKVVIPALLERITTILTY